MCIRDSNYYRANDEITQGQSDVLGQNLTAVTAPFNIDASPPSTQQLLQNLNARITQPSEELVIQLCTGGNRGESVQEKATAKLLTGSEKQNTSGSVLQISSKEEGPRPAQDQVLFQLQSPCGVPATNQVVQLPGGTSLMLAVNNVQDFIAQVKSANNKSITTRTSDQNSYLLVQGQSGGQLVTGLHQELSQTPPFSVPVVLPVTSPIEQHHQPAPLWQEPQPSQQQQQQNWDSSQTQEIPESLHPAVESRYVARNTSGKKKTLCASKWYMHIQVLKSYQNANS